MGIELDLPDWVRRVLVPLASRRRSASRAAFGLASVMPPLRAQFQALSSLTTDVSQNECEGVSLKSAISGLRGVLN